MVLIFGAELQELTLDKVKELEPNIDLLDIENGSPGLQPTNTLIAVELIFDNIICKTGEGNRKHMQVQQTFIPEDPPKKFEIFIYGMYANIIESLIKSFPFSAKKVILIRNGYLMPSVRTCRPGWNSMNVKLSEKDSPDFQFVVCVEDSSSIVNGPYEPIVQFCDQQRVKMMAVLVKVVKPTTVLSKNNCRHTIWIVKDQSCVGEQDLLVQIFFNKAGEKFPVDVDEGDVVRFSMVVGARFADKIQGKVYTSNAITIYKVNGDVIKPYNTKCSYILTELDKKLVSELYTWYHNSPRNTELNILGDSGCYDRMLRDIDGECYFNLYCQIYDVRHVKSLNTSVIRVIDGSKCTIYSNQIDLIDTTQQLNSETDVAIKDSTYIDILVHNGVSGRDALQPHRYVYLKRTKCVMSCQSPVVLHEFVMGAEQSKVVFLENDHKEAKKIRSRMQAGGVEFETQLSSQNSAYGLVNTVANLRTSQDVLTFNPNTGKRQLSPQTPIESRKRMKNVSFDNSIDFIDGSAIVNGSSDTNGHTNTLRRSPVASYPVFGEELNLTPVSRSIQPCPSENDTNSMDFIERTPIADVTYTKAPDVRTTTRVCKYLGSVCSDVMEQTLKVYLEKKPNHIVKIPVFITSLNGVSDSPCKCCDGCKHDWVWGICEACGVWLPPEEVRRLCANNSTHYNLKCGECASILLPSMIIQVTIQDPNDDDISLSILVVGDEAERFLDIKASFRYNVDGIPNETEALLKLPPQAEHPIYVGLEKISNSFLLHAKLKEQKC